MSTSELRRGPGWWMDLDGSWKPPEHWPESSPPLPGWVRDAEGLWAPPGGEFGMNGSTDATVATSTTKPEPSLYAVQATTPQDAPPTPGAGTDHSAEGSPPLSFSQATADVRPDEYVDRERRAAFSAAGLAGVTALMLAAGLVVLLALIF